MRKEIIKMERKFRYEVPTQVKFLDLEAEEEYWIGGIAYGANIICGCCGGVLEIADIYADWDEVKQYYEGIDDPIVPYVWWEDISHKIMWE